MVMIIGARASAINVVNNLTESKVVNVDIVNEFNVHFGADDGHCSAVLKAGFRMQEHPETLTVLCTIIGEFSADKIASDEDKKNIHVACYYALFPYAQAQITRLCTDAGLPPFFLQPVEMKAENVVIAV